MKTSREDRILQIVSQYPGLTAVAIEWSLVEDYYFRWLGRWREHGKVQPALIKLAEQGRIVTYWYGDEVPKKRVYYVAERGE